MVLRWNRLIVGAATLRHIDDTEKTKVRNLCPKCSSSKVARRLHVKPSWRCSDCREEFEAPKRREDKVKAFAAQYRDFIRPRAPLDEALFRNAWAQQSDQLSIRELAVPVLERLLGDLWPEARDLLCRAMAGDSLTPEESENDEKGHDKPFVPSFADQRQKTLRTIRQRRGQQKFRKSLLRAFSNQCVFSGCKLPPDANGAARDGLAWLVVGRASSPTDSHLRPAVRMQ